jgi:hypothetical protein
MSKSIGKQAIQGWLCPALTPVNGNCDFAVLTEQLEHIDRILEESSVLNMAREFALQGLGKKARPQDIRKRIEMGERNFRCEFLRHKLGMPSFRDYSVRLAGDEVLSNFCKLRDIRGVRNTSKSVLDRASKFFTQEQLREMFELLTEVACSWEHFEDIGLKAPVDSSFCLVDSTCLEANIHYPVDWVLLRDVSRTLLKAVKLIRDKGKLLNRMPQGPGELAAKMNKLCQEMTLSHRRADSLKLRKKVLRKMKTLLRQIGNHAQTHRDLLETCQKQTGWSPKQVAHILARMDKALEQLPEVIHQAHERIIGGRKIKSDQKILSIYDQDLNPIVRKKAGKEIEFGNGLFLAENFEGFLLDYKLYQEYPPADSEQLLESLKRQEKYNTGEKLQMVVGDRQFDTRKVSKALKKSGIEDMNCPRNPVQLKERSGDPIFEMAQKRRSGTEARIAIIKNNGGRRWRAKGYTHRNIAVSFAALSHNLTWLANLQMAEACIEQAA